MKKEDIPDVLWLVNAEVEHLTPEQVRAEEEKEREEYQPIDPVPIFEPVYIPDYNPEPTNFDIPQIGNIST